MNHTQKKYAVERVGNIKRDKEATIRDRHTTPAKDINHNEMVRLIASGKVRKKKNLTDMNFNDVYHLYLTNVFDFSKYIASKKVDQDAIIKEMKPVNKECQRIKDQIMLGDAKEALEMILAFEKM